MKNLFGREVSTTKAIAYTLQFILIKNLIRIMKCGEKHVNGLKVTKNVKLFIVTWSIYVCTVNNIIVLDMT